MVDEVLRTRCGHPRGIHSKTPQIGLGQRGDEIVHHIRHLEQNEGMNVEGFISIDDIDLRYGTHKNLFQAHHVHTDSSTGLQPVNIEEALALIRNPTWKGMKEK
jgi:hypothetical protein